MRLPATGPRLLLKRLREVMAETIGPQERLDKIVQHIAANLVAEVCSVYVLRADGMLELFATEGLNPDAVHQSLLKVGQGLVGTIAAHGSSLNLKKAETHPAFEFLPETGEEIYNSFLGVPMLRAGRSLGVLVIQNKSQRQYGDEEVEALETSAMVLAELVAAGELETLNTKGIGFDLSRPVNITGSGLSEGLGLGRVVLHEPRVVVTNLFNEDVDSEIARLRKALIGLRVSIDDMLVNDDMAKDGDHRDILEVYKMYAHDRGWVRRMEEAITNGLTAEAATEKIQSENRSRIMHQSDPFTRERLHDFDDLARRLLRQLMGKTQALWAGEMPKDAIVVGRTMGAGELLDYHRSGLRALVLEEATANSHVVIIARALGLAVVGQATGLVSRCENGDVIIVDGSEGSVHLRPANDIREAYADKARFRAKRQAHYAELVSQPSVTKDGVEIELMMNAGLMVDMPQLELSGATGIGLFRTELHFMVAESMPRMQEQAQFYSDILDAAQGKTVTFRMLDIGGDKVLPYLKTISEDNPALGWRALRLAIDRPGLLRVQMRGMLRAAGGRDLRFMLPMVTEPAEIDLVRQVLERELGLMDRFSHERPKTIQLGSMIEVPNLLWQLDELMQKVDFVSVGSNDLFQYITASDRGNPVIANRYSPLSPSFLRALRSIVEAGKRNNIPVHLCGEIASRPLSAMALLGIGFRSISMPPAAIGPVKSMILALNQDELTRLMAEALDSANDRSSLVPLLSAFADRHGIPY